MQTYTFAVPAAPGRLASVLSQLDTPRVLDVYATHPETKEPVPYELPTHDLTDWLVTVLTAKEVKPVRIGIGVWKDEADFASVVRDTVFPQLDAVYLLLLDDDPEPTLKAMSNVPQVRCVLTRSELKERGRLGDWARQVLVDRARADYPDTPKWVVNVQGDETYPDNGLRLALDYADLERATTLCCQVATFVYHDSQREYLCKLGPKTDPLVDLHWYVWDFGEFVGWLDRPWVGYRHGEHMRAHPRGLIDRKDGAYRPLRRHYPFRSIEQAAARLRDRVGSGWQPHYANYAEHDAEGRAWLRFFKDGEKAAGRELHRYHGWFPQMEYPKGWADV